MWHQVKCDQRPGGCANCERLQLRCPGDNAEQLVSADDLRLPSQAGTKRKKTYRSCIQCRNSKTRCSGDRPVCLRCQRKDVKCLYDSEADPAWARSVFPPTSASINSGPSLYGDDHLGAVSYNEWPADSKPDPRRDESSSVHNRKEPRGDSIAWYE